VLAFFIGPPEIIVVLVVAVLLFGRRLPEVGRSLGKGIVEFKRGIRDLEDDIDQASDKRPPEKVEEPTSNLPADDTTPVDPPKPTEEDKSAS